MDDDMDVDDILGNHEKNKNRKKKINSGRKGKKGERNLIEELNVRFPGMPFSRTVGSGNRWSQARLTEAAKKVFTGDIIAPENFLFALECKNGYNHINIENSVKRAAAGHHGHKELNGFLEQAIKDGERVSKNPMMCWKQDYQPWLVFLLNKDLPKELQDLPERTIYNEWSIFPLSKVLERPDNFFFAEG